MCDIIYIGGIAVCGVFFNATLATPMFRYIDIIIIRTSFWKLETFCVRKRTEHDPKCTHRKNDKIFAKTLETRALRVVPDSKEKNNEFVWFFFFF